LNTNQLVQKLQTGKRDGQMGTGHDKIISCLSLQNKDSMLTEAYIVVKAQQLAKHQRGQKLKLPHSGHDNWTTDNKYLILPVDSYSIGSM
jgi:hypothetical protein